MRTNSKSKRGSKRKFKDNSEEMSFYEVEERTEELRTFGKALECISEGEEDYENIINREILF
jgi:hypothetical protein